MKLTKFHIQNLKSIINSDYYTFASDLTILVGKNESWKTTTLEARNISVNYISTEKL